MPLAISLYLPSLRRSTSSTESCEVEVEEIQIATENISQAGGKRRRKPKGPKTEISQVDDKHWSVKLALVDWIFRGMQMWNRNRSRSRFSHRALSSRDSSLSLLITATWRNLGMEMMTKMIDGSAEAPTRYLDKSLPYQQLEGYLG